MLATTHLFITIIILSVAVVFWGSIPNNIIISTLALGVLIDIDHLIVHPKKSLELLRGFLRGDKGACHYYMHSYLQEPWFGLLVLLISGVIFWQTGDKFVFLPSIALLLHIFLDYLMDFDNLLFWPFSKRAFRGFIPSNTTIEYFASIALLLISSVWYIIL